MKDTKPIADLDNLKGTHEHEEKLRAESLAIIEQEPGLKRRLVVIEQALNIFFAFSHDYEHQSDDELTLQFFGIRLFNTGTSALKLAIRLLSTSLGASPRCVGSRILDPLFFVMA